MKMGSGSTFKFVQLTVLIVAALDFAQGQAANISGNWNFTGTSGVSGRQFSGTGQIAQLVVRPSDTYSIIGASL
jgi:hypothetical protein